MSTGTGNLVTSCSESYNFGGLTLGGTPCSFTTNEIQKFDETIPASLTDEVVAFVGDAADSTVQGIVADHDCTVKTYASTTLKQTFTLKAKVPMFWNTSKLSSLKVFTDNFDSIKVTTGASATRVQIGLSNMVTD